MTKLRVLVTESEPCAADVAVDELLSAGHEVVRCSEPGTPSFPCAALRNDGGCPLRTSVVDVALAVRRRAVARPARSEDGALCAVRHHVPLVVAGGSTLDPFEPWESAVLGRTYDVVETCERTASSPLRVHTERAARAARDTVVAHGRPDLSFLVAVRRIGGQLVAEVREPCSIGRALQDMIAVRIVAALREFDKDARGIDVRFSPPSSA
jgi:hypothetical protein